MKKLLDEGKLAPDDLINPMVKDRLAKEDCKKGFILNGYPRNLVQVKFLESVVKIDKVVVLDVPEKIAIDRVSSRRVCTKCSANYNVKTMPPRMDGICDRCGSELGQREDDYPAAIKKRLQIYHKQTAPLIQFYKRKKVVTVIDGAKPIEEVQKVLLRLLRKRKR